MKKSLLLFFLLVSCSNITYGQNMNQTLFKWGNALYINMSIGESINFLGKSVKLVSIENNWCIVDVNNVQQTIIVARRALPTVVNGIRIFISDNSNVEQLTINQRNSRLHGALVKDVLLCLSDPSKPLLDPSKYTFPIDKSDGYIWTKATNSHMWGYLRPVRSHEGIDIDMNRARGKKIDALVAIEDGIVRWKADGDAHQSCLLLESKTNPGIYYIYQHLNRETVNLKDGIPVKKGQFLAYIWGDGRWGHLHFAVSAADTIPKFNNRYISLLNCFPQLYELWHGDLNPHTPLRTSGHFTFAKQYWLNGNEQCLNGYDDILGYGWDLGHWCTAWSVERSSPDEGQNPDQSAILRKTIHMHTGRPATNPADYYDFEISVPNGFYMVNSKVGNSYAPTWQKVSFEGVDAGTFELKAGEVIWAGEKRVSVSDGKITIRFYLRDNITEAGCYELYFYIAS